MLSVFGQFDFDEQLPEDKKYTEDIIDDVYGITIYEPLNMGLSQIRKNGKRVCCKQLKEDFYQWSNAS